ncbi:cupin domain-containing protein [Streptomyces sp. NBC_00669]|uniref:JmjC domain-containing protein n=1 Tax=Streptomyces sp. NBC_00669 TaxID=2976011 RepID=UPI002E2FE554|nr:cupin domain-containing protein [Streptomyces sp. NBC_00669]
MTHEIIAERLGQDEFLAQAYTREYRHVPGVIKAPGALLSFDTLNDLIGRARLEPPRLRLSVDGEALPQYQYAEPVDTRRHTVWHRVHPDELHQRLAEGASLVIDAIDELHGPIGDLAAGLEGWLRTGVQVNAYASWTKTEGFGTHWDDHDVIVVQVSGSKTWKLYGPTRHKPMYRDVAAPEEPPEDPLAELVLNPGDVLYLPRGWWHAVTADQGTPSLHLTCGLTPHTGAGLLAFLSEMLRSSELVRSDLPLHAPVEEQRFFLSRLGRQVATALADPSTLDWYAATRDAQDVGRLRPSLPYITSVPQDPSVQVRLTTGRARITGVDEGGQHFVRLTAAGSETDFAPTVRPLLELLVTGGWRRLGDLADAASIPVAAAAELVSELVAARCVTIQSVGVEL